MCLTSLNKIFPVRRVRSGVLPVLPHQKLLSAWDDGDGRGIIRSMLPPKPSVWGKKKRKAAGAGIYILVCLMINYRWLNEIVSAS